MASDAINDVSGGIEDSYRIAPATLQRFASGATKRPNSRLLALLVIFAPIPRWQYSERRDLIGRFVQEQAKRNLIRNFEKLLDWKKPADADGEDRTVEPPDNLWPRSRMQRVRTVEHSLFYSLMDYFKIDGVSHQGVRPATTGTYKLWRYSTQYEENMY